MKSNKNTVAITFRCDVTVVEQLDLLCRILGIKRSEFFISAITSEYSNLQDISELKDMLEEFNKMRVFRS